MDCNDMTIQVISSSLEGYDDLLPDVWFNSSDLNNVRIYIEELNGNDSIKNIINNYILLVRNWISLSKSFNEYVNNVVNEST